MSILEELLSSVSSVSGGILDDIYQCVGGSPFCGAMEFGFMDPRVSTFALCLLPMRGPAVRLPAFISVLSPQIRFPHRHPPLCRMV